jgi:hypothetical protein
LYLSAKQKLNQKGAFGRVIMLWDESWNTGFVGIVAARLTEEFCRPALLFVKNGDMLKGSARSVESVNIFEALRECSSLISEFGGHSQAAGVNIKQENFELLEGALNDYMNANYPAGAFTPTLYVSGVLTDNLSHKFVKELELLEPYGVGNKRPLFEIDRSDCTVRPVKPLSPHLTIGCGCIDLMYFSGGKYENTIAGKFPKKFIFEYNLSVFRGKEYIKGFVKDIVYGRDAGKYSREEIAINNLSVSSCPTVECDVKYVDKATISQMIADCGEYGTLFIANCYDSIKQYQGLEKLDVNIFNLAAKNLASCLLISPQVDVEIGGFERIVYLDKPLGLNLCELFGKEVFVCDEVDGRLWAQDINTDRVALIGIFKILNANAYNLEGCTAEEVAQKKQFWRKQFAIAVCH